MKILEVIKMKKIRHVHYDVTQYNQTCPICNKIAKNNKSLVNHIFHRNWKDNKHKTLAMKLREDFYKSYADKAKHICPACGKLFLRCLANHFRFSPNKKHQKAIKKQEELILSLFLKGDAISEIGRNKNIFMNDKWIRKTIDNQLGTEKANTLCKENFCRFRKKYWSYYSNEERKLKMAPVREAEWGKLTFEQRKSHPWVIAGKKASLESIKKGSKNQRLAFKLICNKLNNLNWKYNLVIEEKWQIDIACPEKRIYIEWDGRPHRKPLFGLKHLKEVQNRDDLKDKLIVEQLGGTMIRICDEGRFNPDFVKNKVAEIVELISKKELEQKVYRL